MKQVYTVCNRYGIKDDPTRYRVAERALKARDRREGEGWEVRDQDGVTWEWNPQVPKRAMLRNW